MTLGKLFRLNSYFLKLILKNQKKNFFLSLNTFRKNSEIFKKFKKFFIFEIWFFFISEKKLFWKYFSKILPLLPVIFLEFACFQFVSFHNKIQMNTRVVPSFLCSLSLRPLSLRPPLPTHSLVQLPVISSVCLSASLTSTHSLVALCPKRVSFRSYFTISPERHTTV